MQAILLLRDKCDIPFAKERVGQSQQRLHKDVTVDVRTSHDRSPSTSRADTTSSHRVRSYALEPTQRRERIVQKIIKDMLTSAHFATYLVQ